MKVTKEYLRKIIREAIEMEAKNDWTPASVRKAADPSFDTRERSDAEELGQIFAQKYINASTSSAIAYRAVKFIKSKLPDKEIDDAFAIAFVYGMHSEYRKSLRGKSLGKTSPAGSKLQAFSKEAYRKTLADNIVKIAANR